MHQGTLQNIIKNAHFYKSLCSVPKTMIFLKYMNFNIKSKKCIKNMILNKKKKEKQYNILIRK